MKPERLPPGARRPAPSVRIGVGRADPKAEMIRDTGPGSAADDGVGAAAWRRRIAPRHRDAVRGFFGGESAPGAGGAESTAGPESSAPTAPSTPPTAPDDKPPTGGGK